MSPSRTRRQIADSTSTRDKAQTTTARSARSNRRQVTLPASSTIRGTIAEESQNRIQRPARRSFSKVADTLLPRTGGPGLKINSGTRTRPLRMSPARSSARRSPSSASSGESSLIGTNSATATPRTWMRTDSPCLTRSICRDRWAFASDRLTIFIRLVWSDQRAGRKREPSSRDSRRGSRPQPWPCRGRSDLVGHGHDHDDVYVYDHHPSLQLGGASVVERRLLLPPSATSLRLSREYVGRKEMGLPDQDPNPCLRSISALSVLSVVKNPESAATKEGRLTCCRWRHWRGRATTAAPRAGRPRPP